MYTMPPVKSRKYCCICSNYRGKEVDDSTITLHRFPVNSRIRRIWLQRSRLIRKDFVYTNNSYMCSAHFVGLRGPSKENPVQSIFPQKRFKTSTATDEAMVVDEPQIIISTPVPTPSPNYTNHSLVTESSRSVLQTSVLLHDYRGQADIETIPTFFNQEVQTDSSFMEDKSVQCSGTASLKVSTSTQTDPDVGVLMVDSGTQVKKPGLTYEDVKDDSQKLMFYTGISDSDVFEAIFDELIEEAESQTVRYGPSKEQGRPRHLRLIDELFLVLMRLRLGLYLEDLADRFFILKSTCCVIFSKWVDYLHAQLSTLIKWPSRKAVNDFMSEAFREKYPNCRVILDCTELRTETPSSLQYESLMYSDYKSHMTWKGFAGISPAGMVTFISDLWAGSVSDKVITKESGILDLCEVGDAVMVDKGFLISDLTTPRGIHLIIPPFKHKKQQLSKREVQETRTIANLRIHVERQMERIKNFSILKTIMPISMAGQVTKIWRICASLTSLQPPLVYKIDDFDLYDINE